MAATLKAKGLKTALVEKARDNANVTVGTREKQAPVKVGIPNEHSRKHLDESAPTVGVALGVTLNMDNYQSARIDVWLNDSVMPNESVEQAYVRVHGIVSGVLQEIADEYR